MSGKACEVWFYHLERSSVEAVLPELLERTVARGWRALVRTSSTERLERLEGWLWSYRDDSFLAHGLANEPLAERQPILLTTGDANANAAQAMFLIDGAPAGPLEGFERCVVIFDGQDEGALAAARLQWRQFKAAGAPVAYWRQGPQRGWEKQD